MSESSRVAIVTGGARGIGAAIADRFAADGMIVASFDRSHPERVKSPIRSFDVDVADEGEVRDAVANVADTLGAPTVVVNNAGVLRDNLLFKTTAEEWDTVMAVHLRGTFLVSREAQRFMVEHRWGRIISISSTSALGNRGQANYSAAKAGIQGFTKTLAIELGPFGVTANAVAPGFIATDMTAETARRTGVSFDELKDRVAGSIPVGRVGVPADVANAVSFFASDAASFVSGQVLYVAGGPRG